MSQIQKLIIKILSGAVDKNISFADLCMMLQHFGFDERIRGDHHIFSRSDVGEIINIQPDGVKAKPYQVKQVRNIIIKYKLGDLEDA